MGLHEFRVPSRRRDGNGFGDEKGSTGLVFSSQPPYWVGPHWGVLTRTRPVAVAYQSNQETQKMLGAASRVGTPVHRQSAAVLVGTNRPIQFVNGMHPCDTHRLGTSALCLFPTLPGDSGYGSTPAAGLLDDAVIRFVTR